MIIYPYYIKGDQFGYRAFYDGVIELGFRDAFAFYRASLGSSEPIYFALVYFFSGFVDKDYLFSALNGMLAFVVSRLMENRGMRWYVGPFIFFNFYFFVLLFAAERLKVALLIFGIAYLLKGVARYSSLVVSILAHVQVILLACSAQAFRAEAIMRAFLKARLNKESAILAGVIILLLAITPFLANHVYAKYKYYQSFGGFLEIVKPLIFTILACLYARWRSFEAIIASMPILVAAFAIGADRVVIFSYFTFLYYALNYRGGLNVGVLVTSIYFAFKGCLFLVSVITFGDGFHPLG